MLYLAVRISATSYVSQALRREGERQARRLEQARISEDLHDNLKQSVTSLSAMVRAYRSARRAGNAGAAGEILDRFEETAREAGYRVSRPIEELRAGCDSTLDFGILLRQLSRDIECGFSVRVHEDLKVPLDGLCPEELAAAYRMVSEALWNAAKHAGASNIRIESRRVGSVLLVSVRDDGRGFTVEGPISGIGLSLMRTRAEEAGAKLDVISRPGAGTTVQLRFERR